MNAHYNNETIRDFRARNSQTTNPQTLNTKPTWTTRIINSSQLKSKQGYQRTINMKFVKECIENFDPNKVEPVYVSYRDGKYYVMDGQHTILICEGVNGNKPVDMEVAKSVKQESCHFSDERFKWEYKNTTGRRRNENHKITEYKQDTLYRTTKGDEINIKTLYNARNHFVSECGDKRFSKKRIYDSGRFYEMYQEELKYGQEFKLNKNYSESNDEIRQIIKKIFN